MLCSISNECELVRYMVIFVLVYWSMNLFIAVCHPGIADISSKKIMILSLLRVLFHL